MNKIKIIGFNEQTEQMLYLFFLDHLKDTQKSQAEILHEKIGDTLVLIEEEVFRERDDWPKMSWSIYCVLTSGKYSEHELYNHGADYVQSINISTHDANAFLAPVNAALRLLNKITYKYLPEGPDGEFVLFGGAAIYNSSEISQLTFPRTGSKKRLTNALNRTLVSLLTEKNKVITKEDVFNYVYGKDAPLKMKGRSVSQFICRLNKVFNQELGVKPIVAVNRVGFIFKEGDLCLETIQERLVL